MKNKICSVSTIKSPLHETLRWVNYHLNIGIDHMFICFDDPKDKAIKKLKDNNKVTCIKCDEKHFKDLISPGEKVSDINIQKKLEFNAKFVFDLIKQQDYEWMFAHLDSDELLYVENGLKEFLSKINENTNVICLLPLDSVSEKDNYKNVFKEVTLFRNLGKIARFYYPNKMLLQKLIPLIKRNEGNLAGIYFKGHAAGKSIIRTNSQIERFQGHRPIAKEGETLVQEFPSDANILHFNACGFDIWKSKWLSKHQRDNPTQSMSPRTIKLYCEFIHVYKKNSEEELKKLYHSQSYISPSLKIIFLSLGLLRNIKLDEKLFEKEVKK